MAINARIEQRFENAPLPRPAQPMVIAPLWAGTPGLLAKWGGPFDETAEFANAGYDFYRFNFRPELPDRSEFQIGTGEAIQEWWRRIQNYTSALPAEEKDYVTGVALANIRPAWYADP